MDLHIMYLSKETVVFTNSLRQHNISIISSMEHHLFVSLGGINCFLLLNKCTQFHIVPRNNIMLCEINIKNLFVSVWQFCGQLFVIIKIKKTRFQHL